eukprot:SAG31_NODE_786_length_12098_cov_15.117446_2_plen_225_part_00
MVRSENKWHDAASFTAHAQGDNSGHAIIFARRKYCGMHGLIHHCASVGLLARGFRTELRPYILLIVINLINLLEEDYDICGNFSCFITVRGRCHRCMTLLLQPREHRADLCTENLDFFVNSCDFSVLGLDDLLQLLALRIALRTEHLLHSVCDPLPFAREVLLVLVHRMNIMKVRMEIVPSWLALLHVYDNCGPFAAMCGPSAFLDMVAIRGPTPLRGWAGPMS